MTTEKPTPENKENAQSEEKTGKSTPESPKEPIKEYGGRGGLEPTRYGDWEKDGRCTDF